MMSEINHTIPVRHESTSPGTKVDNATSVGLANILTLVVDIQNLVLEYLHSADQLALTTTCRQWRGLRSDATTWKNKFKSMAHLESSEELVQWIDNLPFKNVLALNMQFEMHLKTPTIGDLTRQHCFPFTSSVSNRIDSINLQIGHLFKEEINDFQHLPKLSKLKLLDSYLSSIQFLSACRHLRSLTNLDLNGWRMDATDAEAIAGSEHLCALTTLVMSNNNISDAGVKAIAGSEYLCSLTTLSLSRSSIGAAGARAIAGSEYLRALMTLRLSENNIGAEAITALKQKYPNCQIVI